MRTKHNLLTSSANIDNKLVWSFSIQKCVCGCGFLYYCLEMVHQNFSSGGTESQQKNCSGAHVNSICFRVRLLV